MHSIWIFPDGKEVNFEGFIPKEGDTFWLGSKYKVTYVKNTPLIFEKRGFNTARVYLEETKQDSPTPRGVWIPSISYFISYKIIFDTYLLPTRRMRLWPQDPTRHNLRRRLRLKL
jgi:hypothetical protein